MPSDRTEVTEITTGLALLGFPDIDRALATRPEWFLNVTATQYEALAEARAGGAYDDEFTVAWETGQRFLNSRDGLRGRVPDRLEWKGPKKPPGYEQIPADLQADHVYLISCKYRSNILMNTSPPHLFDRLLAERGGDRFDWFAEVAGAEYQALYDATRSHYGLGAMPDKAVDLAAPERTRLKQALPKRGPWPEELEGTYADLVNATSNESAMRWQSRLESIKAREEMLWRLLRLQPAPYFVLGVSHDKRPLHYRVGTPSELRADFELGKFGAWNPVMRQPTVAWRAEFVRRHDSDAGSAGEHVAVEGHVEVRWSQGRFGGYPEAKIYLDTPHHEVPGYMVLA
ncbi:MAG: hypothetical protein HKN26_15705 [Acidimicrobiales bacterium]|nr:hypothetical protein [Acidimicrobiales bacterium]